MSNVCLPYYLVDGQLVPGTPYENVGKYKLTRSPVTDPPQKPDILITVSGL